MSESYTPVPLGGDDAGSGEPEGKVDAAKHEAADLKDTATAKAGDVASAAKSEAEDVVHEAKSQAKDLYAQTRSELKDQAGVQQQRVASGLRSVGEELGSMAHGTDNPGLASQLVQQASERATGVASWLENRDPGSVLEEVKSYARRKPGTFIAIAAIAGLAAGRLTRALAGNAADEKDAATTTPTQATETLPTVYDTPAATAPVYPPAPVEDVDLIDDTPLYTQRASTLEDGYVLPGDESPR